MVTQAVPFAPPPPGLVLRRVPVLGFDATPPNLRNAGLIPAPAYEAMAAAWHRGAYPAGEVTLHALQDVTVAEEGLVFLPDGTLVEASRTQHTPEEVAAARRLIATTAASPVLTGTHVLCVKRGAANYGHWLAEMLPMALLAHRLLGHGLRFLVPPHEGAIGGTILASLQLAGIAPEQIVRLPAAPCRVASLIMVHGLSLHGLYLSPLVVALLQDLAEPIAPAHPGCNLWVSRAGQPRCLWGERDLGTVLHTLGWQVVNPGSLPFAAQIALFKGAARIGGVMGAGLANLVFAPRGGRVDVLAPAAMPDTFFYLISRLRGLQYRETRCVQTTHSYGDTDWDSGLVMDLPALLAALGDASGLEVDPPVN